MEHEYEFFRFLSSLLGTPLMKILLIFPIKYRHDCLEFARIAFVL
jgi:hypothetical protein